MDSLAEFLPAIIGLTIAGVVLVPVLRKRSREDAAVADRVQEETVARPLRFAGLCRKHRIDWNPQQHKASYGWTSLGGHGWAPPEGTTVGLGITDEYLVITDSSANTLITALPWGRVFELETGGPGQTTTNAGIIGGGFGLWGAIQGMAAAEVVNRVTSRTTVNSFVGIQSEGGGTVLHTSEFTPDQLHIMFSAARGSIAQRKAGSPASVDKPDAVEQLERLVALKEKGALSDAEFERMKAEILSD